MGQEDSFKLQASASHHAACCALHFWHGPGCDHQCRPQPAKFSLDAELRYSASDIEMLAVICARGEWRCCIEGAPFKIVSDHRPNIYFDQTTNAHTLKRRALA